MEDPLSAFGEVEHPFPVLDADHETEPTGPPPAYDSLVLTNDEPAEQSSGVPSSSAAPSTASLVKKDGPKDFEIYVTDPVKQGDGVGAYVSYKVWSKTKLSQYKNPESEVIRRYNDFNWLCTRLHEQNRGVIVPPMPEKNAVAKISATTDFIETRRRGLQVFINRVAEHPVLKYSPDFQLFLEGSEIEWRTEVDRVNSQQKNVGNRISDTLQFFRGLGHSIQELQHTASNLMAGKSDEEEEDPEYLKVKEYVTLLEGHLLEAHRQSARLIKKQNKMADALASFGVSSQSISGMEDAALEQSFKLLGMKAEELAKVTQDQTHDLVFSFEAPLKEACMMVKSVKTVMSDRSSALSVYQQFKQDAWAKRNKVTKLKGTPGVKEEKVAQAERELNEATSNAEKAKEEYEVIVQRMGSELTRFQMERAADIGRVLRDFAAAQAKLSSDTAKAWRQLLPQISSSAV